MSVLDPSKHARDGAPSSQQLDVEEEDAQGLMALFSNPLVGKATVLLLTMAWSTNFAVRNIGIYVTCCHELQL